MQTHEYREINTSHYHSIQTAANIYAEEGWRVVAAIGPQGPGYATSIIIERPVDQLKPDETYVWMVIDPDTTGTLYFEHEIDALRHAYAHNMKLSRIKESDARRKVWRSDRT